MKYFIWMLFVSLFFSSTVTAQVATTRPTLYGGLAIPQGDFANATNTVPKAGFAKNGLCGGFEFGNTFNNESISGIAALSVSVNSMDQKALSSFVQTQTGSYNVSVTAGSYVTVMGLYGIKVKGPLSPTASIYGQAQAGFLFSSMPDWSITVSPSSYPSSPSTVTEAFDWASTIAYGFGGGLELKDKFNIGVRYIGGSPEYTMTVKTTTTKMRLSTSILQIVFGVMF
ncbi:MAG TPA: hypothetical protein VK186_16190 [Candidatus Deferrimicrobium sp.]|nr:hypothetical protein [Candidatus Deferrimicrobium sp.]